MSSNEPVIRRARPQDAAAVAEVWLSSFDAALPTVRRAHTDEQVRSWIRDVVIASEQTWVLDLDGTVAGLLVLGADELDQLYLAPARRGQGLGELLLDHAKSCRPAGLSLWTFQVNEAAQRFYRRHGFVEIRRTDGALNEEREPDVLMQWRPDNQ